MRRRIFTILSAVSLLLCVAMVVLWILNTWVVMMWVYCGERGGPYVAVGSYRGRIEVDYETVFSSGRKPQNGFAEFPANSISDSPWTYFGFDVQLQDPLPPSDSGAHPMPSQFIVPDWFICSVTAVLPVRWCMSYRQRRLAGRKGLCLMCGYDLRASKERCPECGTPIPAQEAKA